eukprot:29148-Pelagococcus_subviridis.AAC.4
MALKGASRRVGIETTEGLWAERNERNARREKSVLEERREPRGRGRAGTGVIRRTNGTRLKCSRSASRSVGRSLHAGTRSGSGSDRLETCVFCELFLRAFVVAADARSRRVIVDARERRCRRRRRANDDDDAPAFGGARRVVAVRSARCEWPRARAAGKPRVASGPNAASAARMTKTTGERSTRWPASRE